MANFKKDYHEGDLWTYIQVHNILPVVMFIVTISGLIYGEAKYRTQLDKTIEYQEVRIVENRSELKELKAVCERLAISTGQVKGVTIDNASKSAEKR